MTLTDAFLQLADEIDAACTIIRNDNLGKPLAALSDVCDQAQRAWSGSNSGYHATVYYHGLVPKPAGVEFNPEWGLLGRWPTHQPDPGWEQMDYQSVVDEILARSGISDVKPIETGLAQLREDFCRFKERAISSCIAAQAVGSDAFVTRKLEQIESLIVATRDSIALTLVRTADWSRDSMAITQGVRVAPHQSLIALALSGAALGNGLSTLESAVRGAALHLEHTDREGRKMAVTGKTVFIGHGRSPLWRELKDFLQDKLHLTVEEFNSVSVAGVPTVVRLEDMLESAAFGFLLMTAEDEQLDGTFHARLNVIHEAGLFQGRLGFRKAIIVMEDTCEGFSNIHGLNLIRFQKECISAKFEGIREVLQREGLIVAQ